jgi:hypothetical protein
MEFETHLYQLTHDLDTFITKKQYERVDLENVVTITTWLMKVVEANRSLSGAQKKSLVIAAITRKLSGNSTPEMKAFLSLTLPVFIDTTISVANRVTEVTSKNIGWSCCCT